MSAQQQQRLQCWAQPETRLLATLPECATLGVHVCTFLSVIAMRIIHLVVFAVTNCSDHLLAYRAWKVQGDCCLGCREHAPDILYQYSAMQTAALI